jgi:uncharacterized membrane protein YraQ (UPF0718 family)
MDFITQLTITAVGQVLLTLQHNWPYLLVSIVIATFLKLYIDTNKIAAFLNRNRGKGVVAATVAAVTTPLCSCGTTAIVLGMMASTMPWAPIVAFMVSSPLSSPEELVYSAGIFGWPFAITFYVASILLGLGGGWVASVLESRGWLANQTRFSQAPKPACACSQPAPSAVNLSLSVLPALQPEASCCGTAEVALPVATASCSCSATPVAAPKPALTVSVQPENQIAKVTPVVFLKELLTAGKTLLVMFVGFAFIGYFLNGLIPESWMAALFGSGNIYNVPLAATLGLPFYINSEASLPLVRAMIDNGMSQGAALAFMISGAGTSIGAITGALTIARWRVVALVVGVLWVGAILSGLVFNWLLMLKIF